MNSNQIKIDGLVFDRHNRPISILYCDSTCTVDLNDWQEAVQSWVDARTALHILITARLRENRIPHSPVIDAALSLLSVQDIISLLHTVVEDENFEFPGLEVKPLAALEACSAALATGDQLIYRLILGPFRINPEDISGAAAALEDAFTQLEGAL